MALSFSGRDKNKIQVLEQLYVAYGKLMYHVSYGILHDSYLAEDAVQTAFMKLTKNNFNIDSVICNKTKYFMVIIVRNASIDIYNQHRRENLYLEDELSNITDDAASPLDSFLSRESLSGIQHALKTMDTKYSDVAVMRYVYDYATLEIASLLGISEQLARVRLHRAKKMLVENLKKERLSDEYI